MKNLVFIMTAGLILLTGCNSWEYPSIERSEFSPNFNPEENYQEQIYFKFLSKFQDPFWSFPFDNRKIHKLVKYTNNN